MDFEKVKQTLERTKDTVVEKGMEAARTAKIKLSIADEKSKLKKAYTQIGELVYDYHATDTDHEDEISEKIELCDSIKDAIADLEAQLVNTTNKVKCQSCGASNDVNSLYCKKCGERLSIMDE